MIKAIEMATEAICRSQHDRGERAADGMAGGPAGQGQVEEHDDEGKGGDEGDEGHLAGGLVLGGELLAQTARPERPERQHQQEQDGGREWG